MGYSLYLHQSLLPPLANLFERYVSIAPGRTVLTRNRYFKVVYFLEGGLELELPDGRRYVVNAGDATSTDQPWTMRYRAALPAREARIHVLVIHFDQKQLSRRRRADSSEMMKLTRAIREQLGGFHYFPGALDQGCARAVLDRIRSLLNDRRSETPAWKIGVLALNLVLELMDCPTKRSEPSKPVPIFKGEAAFKHARDYLLDNFSAKLTLGQIAWQVRLSGEHLERLFKRHAHQTVFEFLDRIRLERARQLLLTTNLPVRQIATQCGFSSSTLFGRHFKARLGQTPLECRLQSRQTERFTVSNVQETAAAFGRQK